MQGTGSTRSRGRGLLAVLIAAGAVLAACTAGASPSASITVQSATLRLDWVPTGYHAPFFLALERGYYKSRGIDLQIFDGKGSGPSVQAVAAGTDTFALASLTSMTLAVAEGAKVKAVATMLQRMPDAVISLKDGANITALKQVEGKRMAYTAGSSGERLFAGLAKVNGIDESKVQQVTLDAGAKLTAVLQGKADFTVDWPFTRGPIIAAQGKIPVNIYYADYGVNVLGHGLMASTDTISSKASMVKAFVEASMLGIDEAVKDPGAAVDAMIKNRPDIKDQRDIQLAQLKGLGDLLHTPATAGKPTGWTAAADWTATLKLLQDYFALKAGVVADTLYTNDFLPKG